MCMDDAKIKKYRDWLNAQSDERLKYEKEAIEALDTEREIKNNSYKWAYQFALDEFDKILEGSK